MSRGELAEEAADHEQAEEPDDRPRRADRSPAMIASGRARRGRGAHESRRERQPDLPARGITESMTVTAARPHGDREAYRQRRPRRPDEPARRAEPRRPPRAAARPPKISQAWVGDHSRVPGPATSVM